MTMTQTMQKKVQRKVSQLVMGGSLLLLSLHSSGGLQSFDATDYQNLNRLVVGLGGTSITTPAAPSGRVTGTTALSYETAFCKAIYDALNKNVRPRIVAGRDSTAVATALTNQIVRLTSFTKPTGENVLPLGDIPPNPTLQDATQYLLSIAAPMEGDAYPGWASSVTGPYSVVVQPMAFGASSSRAYRGPYSMAELISAANPTNTGPVTSSQATLPTSSNNVAPAVVVPGTLLKVALQFSTTALPATYEVKDFMSLVASTFHLLGNATFGLASNHYTVPNIPQALDSLLSMQGGDARLASFWGSVAGAAPAVTSPLYGVEGRITAVFNLFARWVPSSGSSRTLPTPSTYTSWVNLPFSGLEQEKLYASWKNMGTTGVPSSVSGARPQNAVYRAIAFRANQMGLLDASSSTINSLKDILTSMGASLSFIPSNVLSPTSPSPVTVGQSTYSYALTGTPYISFLSGAPFNATQNGSVVTPSGLTQSLVPAIKERRAQVTNYGQSSLTNDQDATPLLAAISQQITRATYAGPSNPSEWYGVAQAVTPATLAEAGQVILSLGAQVTQGPTVWQAPPTNTINIPGYSASKSGAGAYTGAPTYPTTVPEFFANATMGQQGVVITRNTKPTETSGTPASSAPASWADMYTLGYALTGSLAGRLGTSTDLQTQLNRVLSTVTANGNVSSTVLSDQLNIVANYQGAGVAAPFDTVSTPPSHANVSGRFSAYLQGLGATYNVGQGRALLGTDDSTTLDAAAAPVFQRATGVSDAELPNNAPYRVFLQKSSSRSSMVLLEAAQGPLQQGLRLLGDTTPPSLSALQSATGADYRAAVQAANAAYIDAYATALKALREVVTDYGDADAEKDTTSVVTAIGRQNTRLGASSLAESAALFLNTLAPVADDVIAENSISTDPLTLPQATPLYSLQGNGRVVAEYTLANVAPAYTTISDILTLIGGTAPTGVPETKIASAVAALAPLVIPQAALDNLENPGTLASLSQAFQSYPTIVGGLVSYQWTPQDMAGHVGSIPSETASFSGRVSQVLVMAKNLATNGSLSRTNGDTVTTTYKILRLMNQNSQFQNASAGLEAPFTLGGLTYVGRQSLEGQEAVQQKMDTLLLGAPLTLLRMASANGQRLSFSTAAASYMQASANMLSLTIPSVAGLDPNGEESLTGDNYITGLVNVQTALSQLKDGIKNLGLAVRSDFTDVPTVVSSQPTIPADLVGALVAQNSRFVAPGATDTQLVNDGYVSVVDSSDLPTNYRTALNIFSGITDPGTGLSSLTTSGLWDHSAVAPGGYVITVRAVNIMNAAPRAPQNMEEFLRVAYIGDPAPAEYTINPPSSSQPLVVTDTTDVGLLSNLVDSSLATDGTDETALYNVAYGLDRVAQLVKGVAVLPDPAIQPGTALDSMPLVFEPSLMDTVNQVAQSDLVLPGILGNLRDRITTMFGSVLPQGASFPVSYTLASWLLTDAFDLRGLTSSDITSAGGEEAVANRVAFRAGLSSVGKFAPSTFTNPQAIGRLLLGSDADDLTAEEIASRVTNLAPLAAAVLTNLGCVEGDWTSASTASSSALTLLTNYQNAEGLSGIPSQNLSLWEAAATGSAALPRVLADLGQTAWSAAEAQAAAVGTRTVSSLVTQMTRVPVVVTPTDPQVQPT